MNHRITPERPKAKKRVALLALLALPLGATVVAGMHAWNTKSHESRAVAQAAAAAVGRGDDESPIDISPSAGNSPSTLTAGVASYRSRSSADTTPSTPGGSGSPQSLQTVADATPAATEPSPVGTSPEAGPSFASASTPPADPSGAGNAFSGSSGSTGPVGSDLLVGSSSGSGSSSSSGGSSGGTTSGGSTGTTTGDSTGNSTTTTGNGDTTSGTPTVSTVPEPGSALMMALGLAGLFLVRRRGSA